MTPKHRRLIKRACDIHKKLAEVKPLYRELDEITEELAMTGFKSDGSIVLVDNFADKNTCFRAHGIKRFELLF